MTDFLRQRKWDLRYLDLAARAGSWSKDPSTKVGAVLVRPNNRVAALGFNGFPPGEDDSPHLYLDKEYKHRHVIHAEVNALDSYGEFAVGHTLYSSFPCCTNCVAEAAKRGVSRIVSPPLITKGRRKDWVEKWGNEIYRSTYLAMQKGIAYDIVI